MTASLPEGYDQLNDYSRIIVDEALRRGIGVEVLDPDRGELVLTRNGRSVRTIQSLSELTSAVAFRRCDDKLHTRRVLADAGLHIPPGRQATLDEEDAAFLARHRPLVVKPVRGEGGEGVTVGVTEPEGLAAAVEVARAVCPEVLLEQHLPGEDLRIVVIDGEVVAASVRRPPRIEGNGHDTVRALVEQLERVPLDDVTAACVEEAGWDLDDVLPRGEAIIVRGTANVHTGGTISDITANLHPDLAAVAVRAAEAIGIPVLGLDLIVPSVDGPDYTILEANEQPGLANHEPQPTAERFIDLLFP